MWRWPQKTRAREARMAQGMALGGTSNLDALRLLSGISTRPFMEAA